MPDAFQALLAAAAVVTALGVLWRWLHMGELLRGTRLFLLDWFGQPERPGAEAVPGFPERMSSVEKRTADLADDFRGELTTRLTQLAFTVDRTHDHLTTTANDVQRLDARVSDHRRRNDEQIQLLREAITRTEQQVHEIRDAQRKRRADHQENRDV